MKSILLVLILLGCTCCSITDKRKEKIIAAPINREEVLLTIQMAMNEQIECWNSGNIPCFMEAYWPSDSLVFIGKSGINYGWQKTLDNYLISYPNLSAMGTLTFTNEILQFIDAKTIQVIGKWHLTRDELLGDIQGYYSLLWQEKNGKWVIISDHSS
jgi:hypothetical protein